MYKAKIIFFQLVLPQKKNCFKINKTTYQTYTAGKVSKYGVFSDPYFRAFGLNTQRYEVSLRIQFECGKIRTRKNSLFGHFSRSDIQGQ